MPTSNALRVAAAPRFTALPPLTLYVHLPWCVRKCPYCDFNSYEARGALPERAYVAALLRDLAADAELCQGRALASIFIGGGTPSLFSGTAIAELLEGIRTCVPVRAHAEITLEANPGAIEAERFAEYRAAGVNRLSIGVQSFREPQLRRLGRVHGAADALRAVETARSAGFDNLNLDLMYGLPDDDVEGALADLRTALDLEPEHVSWYQLTLEPNTAFHRRPPRVPPEGTVVEMEQLGRELLAASGYERYEVSAYARAGRRCAHNRNYWEFGDYVGIGAGAHGKITMLAEQAVLRRAKRRNPRSYVESAGTAAAWTDEDATDGVVVEFMMNALRLVDGVPVELFEERTGCSRAAIEPAVTTAVARGWLVNRRDRLQPTAAGLNVLNRLLELF